MTTWKEFAKNGAFFFTPDNAVETTEGVTITHTHEGKEIKGELRCSEEEAGRVKGKRCRVQIVAGEEEPSIVAL
jgi:hypothetical protein